MKGALQSKLSNAKSLDECKQILEQALVGYKDKGRVRYSYSDENYYEIIISLNIDSKWKKSLIYGLHEYDVYISPYALQKLIDALFVQGNISFIKFLSKTFKHKRINLSSYGIAEDPINNEKVIKLLNTGLVSLYSQRCLLGHALQVRNMSLITYIVEILKIDLFIPTHINSMNAIGHYLTPNDDLELVKWLEARGYNIHESKRNLLRSAYSANAKRIMAYVLEKQTETDVANLYMEHFGTQAYYKDDVAMLQKYPVIGFNVSQNEVYRALKKHKEFIYIKVLLDRYVTIQLKRCAKYSWSSKNLNGYYVIFNIFHISKFSKLATYGNVWTYISEILYKYGSTEARASLVASGFVAGATTQPLPPANITNPANANENSEHVDESDEHSGEHNDENSDENSDESNEHGDETSAEDVDEAVEDE